MEPSFMKDDQFAFMYVKETKVLFLAMKKRGYRKTLL